MLKVERLLLRLVLKFVNNVIKKTLTDISTNFIILYFTNNLQFKTRKRNKRKHPIANGYQILRTHGTGER